MVSVRGEAPQLRPSTFRKRGSGGRRWKKCEESNCSKIERLDEEESCQGQTVCVVRSGVWSHRNDAAANAETAKTAETAAVTERVNRSKGPFRAFKKSAGKEL